MNRDVTITISTAGEGTVSVGAPGPDPTDVANAERLAGAPRGPIPTPLDQLPKASGALGDPSSDAGPPAPMEIANLAAAAANAGGQAPPPVDLDLLAPAAARSSARRKPAARRRK